MATILMRARVPLVQAGTPRVAGETFTVPALEAAVLRYQQRADFVAVPAPTARKKRTYRRRDLRAED